MNKIILVLVLLVAGCSQKQVEDSFTRTYVDGLDREVTIDGKVQRVIGLSPALTEILFFVTKGKKVVARTQNDNFPKEVKGLPVVVNYPKLDMESLLLYKPDVVFAEIGITPEPELRKLEEYGVNVFWVKVFSIEQLLNSMQMISEIITENDNNPKVDSLAEALEALPIVPEAQRKTALVLASVSPMYVYGYNTLMTEKLKYAGLNNVITREFPGDYPEVSREYLLQLDPDYILGYSFDKMNSTYFTIYPEMKRLRAYQNKNIFPLDHDLASRPSPRVLESILEMKNLTAN